MLQRQYACCKDTNWLGWQKMAQPLTTEGVKCANGATITHKAFSAFKAKDNLAVFNFFSLAVIKAASPDTKAFS